MSAETKLLIYSLFSLLFTIFILLICKNKIKTDETKQKVLKMIAVVTVLLHYSSLWVDYFTTGTAVVDGSMLLPIYPCNICMWLLLIVAFIKKQETKLSRIIIEFTGFAGVVCGTLGLILNENFLRAPSFLDYYSLKGLLSHSTLILGCLYLFVMNYININVLSNMFSCAAGLIFFVVDGFVINMLYKLFNMDSPNAMYLEENPFPNIPYLNTLTMGLAAMLLLFVFTSIYEQIKLPREKRWYQELKKGK